MSLSPAFLHRLLACMIVAAFFVAALASILPGRSAGAGQLVQAAVRWQNVPDARVLSTTEYVDAKLCRSGATVLAGSRSEAARVVVACTPVDGASLVPSPPAGA
jgi:hypothetical protein